MTNTVQIGKRLIPVEQIALIEPFEPSEQSNMKSTRPFQTRVVLIDRDSVLTEEALALFEKLSRPMPPGFRFDREEANARR